MMYTAEEKALLIIENAIEERSYYNIDCGHMIDVDSETMAEIIIGRIKPLFAHQSRDEGWVSIEDRLPETRPAEECCGTSALSVDVQVIDENGDQFTGYYNYTEAGSGSGINPWEECFTEVYFGTKITHWRPLPPPPVKDETKK